MREKLDIWKWYTSLSPEKRIVAVTFLIIISLGTLVYGLTGYIKGLVDRDRKECYDNNLRLNLELNDTQNKLETANNRLLLYIEQYAKNLERLEVKTEILEKKLNENN